MDLPEAALAEGAPVVTGRRSACGQRRPQGGEVPPLVAIAPVQLARLVQALPLGPHAKALVVGAGTVLTARIAGVPIVPIGCAADRAWYLEKRWDRFMIPKPFARVVIAVGEPVPVPRSIALDDLEPVRVNVQERVMSLMEQSEQALDAP